jgi:CRP-like cAMP-binding protein
MTIAETTLAPGVSAYLNSSFRAGGRRTAAIGGMPITAKRLDALASLTNEDLKVLSGLRGRTVKSDSLVAGDPPGSDCASLILSGWCARVSPGKDGHNQITGIMLPGDAFGLGGAPWAGDRLNVLTLTSCILVDATALRQLIRLRSPAHSRLIEACHRLSWLEQTYALNHIVRLAGRNGYQRVAHFLAELYSRMHEVDLVRNGSFPMPLTQKTIADVLGLSKVHLNRVTRQLTREGLVDFPRGGVRVPDIARLADVANFEHFTSPTDN